MAALVPLLAEPAVRAEQVTQLVLGETAQLLARDGEWRRVRAAADGYEGWTHSGYLSELDDSTLSRWETAANVWCEGAELEVEGVVLRVPLRARLAVDGGPVQLPDGRRGRLTRGRLRTVAEVRTDAGRASPEEWAAVHFLGAPYQWGGVTPWGADCSGMVQTTFAARGIALPRNSPEQVRVGTEVPIDAFRPGDLLFFRGENTERITHVAFAGSSDTLVHATIACGGAVRESWAPGTRAWPLRQRLVAVRRIG